MYRAGGSQEGDASEVSPVLRELNRVGRSPGRAHFTVQIQTEGDVDVRPKPCDFLSPPERHGLSPRCLAAGRVTALPLTV